MAPLQHITMHRSRDGRQRRLGHPRHVPFGRHQLDRDTYDCYVLRSFLLFIHIVGAAGWIGGGLFAMFGVGNLARAGGPGNGRAIEVLVEKAGIYFGAMFALVILGGVGLVITQDQWGWTDTFVWVGIGAIVVSGVWQGLYASKADAKLLEAVKNESQDRLEALSKWRRTAWVDVAILLVALWAMVTKLQ